MSVVWGYAVPVLSTFELSMPDGAQILGVQSQRDVGQLWALVDFRARPVTRRFELVGTGAPFVEMKAGFARHYVGTFQVDGGERVLHLFEHKRPLPPVHIMAPWE